MITALGSFVLAIAVVALLAVMGRTVSLPDWAVEQVEAQVNAQVTGSKIDLDGVVLGLPDDRMRPTIELQGLKLQSNAEDPVVALPTVQAELDSMELLRGQIALKSLDIRSAQINLTRDEQGDLLFAFQSELETDSIQVGSVADVMKLVDDALDSPALRELDKITATGVRLALEDRRNDQRVEIEQGRLRLTNGVNFVALDISFDVSMGDTDPSTLVLLADKAKGASGGRFRAEFKQLRVRDIAQQFSTLNFLDILDAPVDGRLTTEFGDDGQLVSFAGQLDIGQGVLQPAPQAKPLPINSASTDVRYSVATGRLHLEDLHIDAAELRLSGQAHADLHELEAGIPQSLLMQLRVSDLKLDPEGVFDSAVSFSQGQADLRYRPNDLKLDIGQIVLREADAELVASGSVSVGDNGWLAALDTEIAQIEQQHLLALWPTSAAPKTRDWLTKNILAGQLTDVAAGLRIIPNSKPKAAVTFNFDQADVIYLKTLPPIQNGQGYVSIAQNEMTLALHKGEVFPPNGGKLDVSGSLLQIPELEKDPPDAEIRLLARGPVPAALSLLDEKPFEFLSKAGLPTDIAQGRADIRADLKIPLVKDVPLEALEYTVVANLRDLRSDRLVDGHTLRAEALDLRAGQGELSIAGPATIDGIPLNLRWARALGRDVPDISKAAGTIEISPRSLAAFNIDLPPGSVTGRGTGQFDLTLEKGKRPQLQLTSELRGLGMQIEALGWRKPLDASGDFSISVTLADTPIINRMQLTTAGLSATGDITLRPGGGLERAVFLPLRVADRLNSRVEVIGQGPGNPVQLRIQGGTIDIRKFGVGGRANRGSAGGPPIELRLESLRVTDDIRIDGFRGSFRNARGLEGSFTGQINGLTNISGTVIPTQRGLAVQINSTDAGGVIAATGLLRNARGGEMRLVLQPTGRAGEFSGRLKIADTRVKDAPALADLLSAISVVGLLEQLSGDGILFSEVDASFTLSPGGVRLHESRAVGPSLGITMDGLYSTNSRRMQMQGVVSPIYLLNRPLGFLFARKGEGLIGFNYAMTGLASAPRVTFNPLSVFTPGVFREIFRRAPPERPANVQN